MTDETESDAGPGTPDKCEEPNCRKLAHKTYTDPNGNDLAVCGRHYYELVSGRRVRPSTPDSGLGLDPVPGRPDFRDRETIGPSPFDVDGDDRPGDLFRGEG